ncbi:MAG: nitroreductase family protein [Holophagales bacterium]|jgi:nitroreductase|nr:nitroreductase family protein [Holophagales bacterium]
MSFLELAKKRYSVRNFKPNAVEQEKLQTILEAGRVAPTGANCQPQRLVVIQRQEYLEKISKATNTFGAPLVILVCAERETAWIRPFDGKNILDIDASIITDHMMLQATELGLGSLWICYFNPDVLKKELNLPNAWEPVNILAIGYANDKAASPDRHQTTRKPLKETVFFETPQSVK